MHHLRRELGKYRIILLVPTPRSKENPSGRRAGKLARKPAPKPLAVPDFRILNRLDPRIAEVVRENPEIENVLTREIVRDVDAKVLDVTRLLKKSSLQLSFEIDDAGHAIRRQVEQSSQVPSIDHLALELVVLLEKYQFLAPMKGLRRVFATIAIDQQVEIRFEGEAADEAAAEEVRKQLQNIVTLMRFALPKTDAAFVLGNVNLTVQEKHVVLSKIFDKEPLVAYLMQYYQPAPQPSESPDKTPPSDGYPPDLLAGL